MIKNRVLFAVFDFIWDLVFCSWYISLIGLHLLIHGEPGERERYIKQQKERKHG